MSKAAGESKIVIGLPEVGNQVEEVLHVFYVFKMLKSKESKNEEIIKKLEEYFKSRINKTYKRIKFSSRNKKKEFRFLH